MCVTCGAWLAVQVWEKILYEEIDLDSVRYFLIDGLLPVFRGIATFFMQYIVLLQSNEDNTTYAHTGPTTSPENSYEIKFTDSGKVSLVFDINI